MFVPFPDEATARAALEANDIDQYVRIPDDYVATGQVTVYDKNFQIREDGRDMGIAFQSPYEWVLGFLINANLTGDAGLVAILNNPVPGRLAERHVVNPPPERDASDQALGQVVASVIPYIFYFTLLVGTGYLMRSVVAEKENRTAEVLLLSLHPRELMIGKILGLSAVTLVQMVIWFGGGMLILDRGAEWLNVSAYTFPPGFILWAALFLLLGFLLYASVMAAAGAMANNAREGGQVTWLLVIPLVPTLMFATMFFEEPNGTLPLVLSLFPFSAPSAMVTRLAITEVPLWQPIVSLLGLAGTTYLMVSLSARFFRAGNLLSQSAFDWRRFVTGWRA
jgi:ABC-2 type transport system permease protein